MRARDSIDAQSLGISLRQKDGTWLHGSVVAQTSTGAVRFQPADGGESQLVRLEHEEYQWAKLATTEPRARARQWVQFLCFPGCLGVRCAYKRGRC